ncbi:MAG: primosomal protein N', partial [Lachnospiraceae bacterium]|nr:primosomal protein N' [Lachnospiraceae bacterium]
MYKKYAAVIVDISHESVDRPFTYRIKEAMKDEITIGSCVTVPFGKGNKMRKGYVVAFSDSADFPDEKIKEIEEIVIKQDDLQGRMIRLAAWIRKHYGSTMIQALKVVLPVKKTVKPIEKKTIVLKMELQEAQKLLETCRAKSQK